MSQSDLKKVVVIGGGTGMPVLLRGLKKQPIDLSAIVTVADDGGSSGRLRSEMEMPAPGDIRNVIAALSDVEPMLMDLFQHRFTKGNGLSGHSMGNLLLAAMTSVTGDFYNGIKEISRVLNVKGNIYPIANQNMFLHAEYEDGEVVVGESNIPKANKRIKRVFLQPNPVLPLPEAVLAIREADLVVIAPGSLYTSTLPNLIVPQIGEALRNTKAKVVYVCNVMTQAGETNHYTASDHVQAIMDHIGTGCLQSVIVHNKTIARDVQMVYAEENAEPVKYDLDRLRQMGLEIIEEDIVKELNHSLRHDTDKVAKVLCSLI
ncbi:uridine diphosphate-N-acetylglucosamine-binding protein YvcK [Gracilibacillus salitolerans]|uniref:Gluconeogenesis factor n=1 Tax=Gracilibacillus salitolerans TaxID=2663022 RepID=A0A5Q2TH17_9BACI|nr:YvcK family protein [Gracilibacillus salitolerans]QGH34129.1 uridine diphosphate-N-acetylglucosamine-binding protein YvcK [Gracilibacillus salitolerans]